MAGAEVGRLQGGKLELSKKQSLGTGAKLS